MALNRPRNEPKNIYCCTSYSLNLKVDTKRKRVNKSHGGVVVVVGGVFLVDPHAFQRHRSSQTQRGWWWQTWSDTAKVLRKRLSPELHSTHTNRVWQWWFTRTNLWFSSWLCPFCDQMSFAASAQTQHNTPAQRTRWLHSKWIWRGKKNTFIKGNYPKEEITKTD